ncbi:DNA topoisomerase [Radiobacillus kanasensis]|uniref:type IA DNA topoisomerase n=1 Tax=Radiobacillus kanasensis TaxID=2844358 RepID=UPI001E62B73E|nr:type IA DNA topoisomerase [Radiobacillus kanasensis]UFU00805.1 DNA topoisomerase [Radiobacillus kanasensis]
MGTTLILAEKPSVAKNIADALHIKGKQDGFIEGNGYIITWAFGHLLELYDAKDYDAKMTRWKLENFPFIPSRFEYKVKRNPRNRSKADPGAYKQYRTIKTLLNRTDVEQIISACDYDREGQLIADSILENIGTSKRVYRLLINEWTEREVLEGLKQVRPNEQLKPLRDAGITRQWTDWVIGINLTSVATLKYQVGRGKALNIGRVLLPTLKIIYDRDKEIKDFKSKDYFKLVGTFHTANEETYQAVYTEGKKDKFEDKNSLLELQKAIEHQRGTIVDKQVERKKEYAPWLFNLSNLQGDITNKYKGWTSDKVLKVAQTLYEKKYITYPRTSSTALDESLVGKTKRVLDVLAEDLPYKDELRFTRSKRIFNNQKVESHSAIIPTYLKPKRLTPDQQVVYDAVKNRFLVQFMPIAEYEETILTTKIVKHVMSGIFISKGRVQITEGWKKVEKIQSQQVELPYVSIGEAVILEKAEVTAHATKPPKQHTEKTLLKVMETCGKGYKDDQEEDGVIEVLKGFSIGTPATRAETIKKLKDVGYITSNQKFLTCTDKGVKLVETFPIQELFDLEYTGRLEKTLADIEKGTVTKQALLDMIFAFTKDSVEKIKQDQSITISEVKSSSGTKEKLGQCPACGGSIIEGKKGFGCSNWKKGCTFVIWKNDKFLATMKKRPTKTMVQSLLKNKVAYVKGLTSKKGSKFNAYLRYEKNPDNSYYSWSMEFKK